MWYILSNETCLCYTFVSCLFWETTALLVACEGGRGVPKVSWTESPTRDCSVNTCCQNLFCGSRSLAKNPNKGETQACEKNQTAASRASCWRRWGACYWFTKE